VAWLGALRAPWCGLSLDDLYTAGWRRWRRRSGRSSPVPVPELLAERLPLAQRSRPPRRRARTRRQAAASALRALRPRPPWEAGWKPSGCGGRERPAWTRLPAPTSTCSGVAWTNCQAASPICSAPALDAALDKLTALPDPAVSSDCGVQLMTIHKSKGLEFEVVIVPECRPRMGAAGAKCSPG